MSASLTRAQYSQNTAQASVILSRLLSRPPSKSTFNGILPNGHATRTDSHRLLLRFSSCLLCFGNRLAVYIDRCIYNDTELNVLYSHELTHALQDQHLGIEFHRFSRYSVYNSDAYIAQTALLEGDARSSIYTYFISTYDPYHPSDPYALAQEWVWKIKTLF